MHPQPRMQNKKAYERSHHGHAGYTRHSPRNGFTAYIALSPVIGLYCLCHRRSCLRQLDAGVEASEPHDFGVRVRAVRQQHISVHRIPSRVRDDREPPLDWDETAALIDLIWGGGEGKSFSASDWTRQITLIPQSKSACWRRANPGSPGRLASVKGANSHQMLTSVPFGV
jgi:hypothetical protein